MGIPLSWQTVKNWMKPERDIFFPPAPTHKPSAKKCPEIQPLSSYKLPPPADFWRSFPSTVLPSHPNSVLNHVRLRGIIDSQYNLLSFGQRVRSDRIIQDLENGAAAPFRSELPGARNPNTPSVVSHGEEFTDTLAWWVRCGYVAGPFAAPPFPDFRTNAMMAVEQKEKIRIVMDLSSPKGLSFNDAIAELALEKVSMSSARLFGYSVVDCGVGARMWKYDMVDAYKNIPAAQQDLRLQGFAWLGRFFVELKKVFGSKEAVSSFDRLNHTLVILAANISGLPTNLIHRTLDDVPFVTPASSEKGLVFAESYENICEDIGASLAPPCPHFEKAFKDSTHGTVLGIIFDTISMTWRISGEKKARILTRIKGPLSGQPVTLLDVQKLIGSLNDVGQMCPFLRGFRQPIHNLLVQFQGNTEISLIPTPEVRADLRIWGAAMHTVEASQPIPRRPTAHLPSALMFVSDASGAQFAKFSDKFITLPYEGERGAASINAIEDDTIWFYANVVWPRAFLLQHRDAADHAYGCKSSTLEAIGLILPFLCIPKILIGKEVTLLTDNEALVFGWEKRRVAHDNSASIFLRALHLISGFLGSSVEIRHLPRMSSPSAEMADALTRSTTTTDFHRNAVSSAPVQDIPHVLLSWLEDPSDDWLLPTELLSYVEGLF
jgi:hypothetical protein